MGCSNNGAANDSVATSRTEQSPLVLQDVLKAGPAVSFQDDVVVLATQETELTEEERARCWYQKPELQNFKYCAKRLSKQMRLNRTVSRIECTRGLERRASLERQRQKSCLIEKVLEAQLWGRTADEIASLSLRNSSSARHIAKMAGQSDYNAVYNDSDEYTTEEEEDDEEEEPISRKRSVEESTRNCKRRKTVAAASPWANWRGRRRIPMWTPETWVTVS